MGKSTSHYITLLIAFRAYKHCMYMQDFFRCEDGYEADAQGNAHRACKKLVHDMHYEARIQAIVNYHAEVLHTRVTKEEARKMTLNRGEYLQVRQP